MLKLPRNGWRQAILASLAAATCWAVPAPAQAAFVDFDNDGIIDEVRVTSVLRTEIVVTVSGTAGSTSKHVLHLPEGAISVVAADVNHDGAIDVSALSERHGLWVWLNRGSRGFRLLHRKRHLPTQAHLSHSGTQLGRSSGDSDIPNPSTSSAPQGIEHAPPTTIVPPVPTGTAHTRFDCATVDRSGASSSRAPPDPI